MNMRYLIWTVVTYLSLVSNTLCKSLLSGLDKPLLDIPTSKFISEKEPQDELQQLKERIRSKAQRNIFNTMSQLNQTLEEKRRLLKRYRVKLQELNQLDDTMDYQENIHKRDMHTFLPNDSDQIGHYEFTVKVAQPADHRKELKVQSATLKLYRKSVSLKHYNASSTSLNQSINRNIGYNTVLLIYQTLPGNMRRLVTSKVISLTRTDWIKIDITEIAQNWLDEPGMNHGLEIECTTHNISQIISQSSTDLKRPNLDIITYEKTINVRRRRRDTTAETCEPGHCCRMPVNIPLADVGLHIDDIHLPGEYIEAYICSGRCPRNHKLHNFWSVIKNSLRSRYSNMRNKCAPTAFESYIYTHLDEEGYPTWTSYDDIIVKECGCV